jgi:hypothetical protein
MNKKIILVISLAVLLSGLIFLVIYYQFNDLNPSGWSPEKVTNKETLSANPFGWSPEQIYNKCMDYNGRIVNTLMGDGCFSNETNFGILEGTACPCICCVDNNKLNNESLFKIN